MTDTTIGGKGLDLSIRFLNQSGAPMSAAVAPDTPPVWTNTAATGTLTVSPDGMTAHYDGAAVGADTVGLTVIVGGTSFSASLIVNVLAPPEVLTSVEIVATPTP